MSMEREKIAAAEAEDYKDLYPQESVVKENDYSYIKLIVNITLAAIIIVLSVVFY